MLCPRGMPLERTQLRMSSANSSKIRNRINRSKRFTYLCCSLLFWDEHWNIAKHTHSINEAFLNTVRTLHKHCDLECRSSIINEPLSISDALLQLRPGSTGFALKGRTTPRQRGNSYRSIARRAVFCVANDVRGALYTTATSAAKLSFHGQALLALGLHSRPRD